MSKSFSNVIILVFWLAGGFAGFAPVVAAAGMGQILFPLGTGLAVGLLGIGLAFGKRARPFDGLWAPLNLNLLAIFMALGTVVAATLGFGLQPFVEAVVGDATALAAQAVLIALNAVVGGALAVISALAARDSDSEVEEAPGKASG